MLARRQDMSSTTSFLKFWFSVPFLTSLHPESRILAIAGREEQCTVLTARAVVSRATVRMLDKTGNEIDRTVKNSGERFQFDRATCQDRTRSKPHSHGFRSTIGTSEVGSKVRIVWK
jgi:hypothetical protein